MLQEEKENSENMDVIDDIKDSDEIKDIKDIKPEEVFLKLGDIILISDPTNEILNDNIFLIEYIDPKKIKLINSDNFEKTLLQILTIYFLCYSIVWALTIAISKQFPKNYLKLGQWILLLLITGLIYFGTN